ncbi:hypothetical protein MKX03_036031 [Papaver bracteatum]|nr:hypothetical protein MKX03_036031 [Papaver bracteatum]
MAAAKTSLVFFIFALIAISANLQTASAVGVQCCVTYCNDACLAKLQVNASASACVAGLLQLLVKSCSCCCASI